MQRSANLTGSIGRPTGPIEPGRPDRSPTSSGNRDHFEPGHAGVLAPLSRFAGGGEGGCTEELPALDLERVSSVAAFQAHREAQLVSPLGRPLPGYREIFRRWFPLAVDWLTCRLR